MSDVFEPNEPNRIHVELIMRGDVFAEIRRLAAQRGQPLDQAIADALSRDVFLARHIEAGYRFLMQRRVGGRIYEVTPR